MRRILLLILAPALAFPADGGDAPKPPVVVEENKPAAPYPVAEAPLLWARPVRYLALDHLPDGASTLFPGEEGFAVSYLVTGDGLAGLKDVNVKAIRTADGSSVPLRVNGDSTLKTFISSRHTDSGRYATFEIRCSQIIFGKLDGLTIEGSVTALVGRDLRTEEQEIDLSTTTRAVFGSFVLVFVQDAEANPTSLTRDRLTIAMTGPMNQLVGLSALEGNAALPKRGVGSRGTKSAHYSFARPGSGKMKLVCRYWQSLAEVPVPFGK